MKKEFSACKLKLPLRQYLTRSQLSERPVLRANGIDAETDETRKFFKVFKTL